MANIFDLYKKAYSGNISGISTVIPTTANTSNGSNNVLTAYKEAYGNYVPSVKLPQISDFKRFSALPNTFKADPAWGQPTKNTRYAAIPGEISGGAYIQEPGISNAFIKSTREVTGYDAPGSYDLRKKLTKGLPLQVDHIIPISLGGADVEANWQALSLDEHEEKTKINAVAQELYFANKISLGQARNLALNWKNYDSNDIDLDENGRLPVEDAMKKLFEWNNYDPNNVSFKQWWDEFKHPIKNTTSILGDAGEAVGDWADKVIPENAVGEAVKGFTSSATLDWVKFKDYDYGDKNAEIQAARFAGNLAGFLTGYKIYMKTLKVVGGALLSGKIISGASMAGRASRATGVTKLFKESIPAWARVATKQQLEASGGALVRRPVNPVQFKIFNVLFNADAFGLHGQLSRQEEETFEARTKRLVQDLSFGAVLGSIGTSKKSIASAWAATYALSAIEGADVPSAMLNAFTVAGLHSIGVLKNPSQLEKIGNEWARKYRTSKGATPKDPSHIYTEAEIVEENGRLILGLRQNENIQTDAEIIKEIERILVSGKQLWKGGLTRDAKFREDWKDASSLNKRNNALTEDQVRGLPDGATKYLNELDRFDYNSVENIQAEPNQKTGYVILSGYGSSGGDPVIGNNVRRAITAGAKPGDRVSILVRDDTKMVERLRGKGITDKKVEVIMTINGERFQIGSIPTEKRITDPIVGINSKAKFYNEKFPTAKPMEVMDPEFNNKYLSEYLLGKGQKVISGKIAQIERTLPTITGRTTVAKEPFVMIEITSSDYKVADIISERVGAKGKETKTEKKSSKIMEAINERVQKKEIIDDKTEIKQPTLPLNEPILEFKTFPPGEGRDHLIVGVKSLQESPSQTSEIILQMTRGTHTSDEIANLKKNAENLTVGDVVKILREEKVRGNLTDFGNNFFNYTIGSGTYYSALTPGQQAIVNRKMLFDKSKLGEIKQEIKTRVDKTAELKGMPEQKETKNIELAKIKKLYHGTSKDIDQFITPEGDLVLIPSSNFDGKVTGISFSPDKNNVAKDYSLRIKGAGGVKRKDGYIIEIEKDALPKEKLSVENNEEVALLQGEKINIPKGKYKILDTNGKEVDFNHREIEMKSWQDKLKKESKFNKEDPTYLIDKIVESEIQHNFLEYEYGDAVKEHYEAHTKGFNSVLVQKYGGAPDLKYLELEATKALKELIKTKGVEEVKKMLPQSQEKSVHNSPLHQSYTEELDDFIKIQFNEQEPTIKIIPKTNEAKIVETTTKNTTETDGYEMPEGYRFNSRGRLVKIEPSEAAPVTPTKTKPSAQPLKNWAKLKYSVRKPGPVRPSKQSQGSKGSLFVSETSKYNDLMKKLNSRLKPEELIKNEKKLDEIEQERNYSKEPEIYTAMGKGESEAKIGGAKSSELEVEMEKGKDYKKILEEYEGREITGEEFGREMENLVKKQLPKVKNTERIPGLDYGRRKVGNIFDDSLNKSTGNIKKFWQKFIYHMSNKYGSNFRKTATIDMDLFTNKLFTENYNQETSKAMLGGRGSMNVDRMRNELEIAVRLAESGDYSRLKELGADEIINVIKTAKKENPKLKYLMPATNRPDTPTAKNMTNTIREFLGRGSKEQWAEKRVKRNRIELIDENKLKPENETMDVNLEEDIEHNLLAKAVRLTGDIKNASDKEIGIMAREFFNTLTGQGIIKNSTASEYLGPNNFLQDIKMPELRETLKIAADKKTEAKEYPELKYFRPSAKMETRSAKSSQVKKIGTVDNPVIGDIWDQKGVKVVTTNLGGVHGRGLAKQAKDNGLITYKNKDVDSSPSTDVITLAVKGNAPETAKIKGQAYSEQVTGGNLKLLESEVDKFIKIAKENPETDFYMPYAGMGFGEGNPSEILPILKKLDNVPNIKMVGKSSNVIDKYKESFKPGIRSDKSSPKYGEAGYSKTSATLGVAGMLGAGSAYAALKNKNKEKEEELQPDRIGEYNKPKPEEPTKKAILTVYHPKKEQTDADPKIGGFNELMEFGDVAISNRDEYEKARQLYWETGEDTFVKIPELSDIKTPYGDGVFRVRDTMSKKYDGDNRVDIFIPDANSENEIKIRQTPSATYFYL